jgi:hypothetical protein
MTTINKEQELVEAMNEIINKDGDVEIPVNTFVGLWFTSGEQLTDKSMTRHLLDFSESNDLDYVSVMNGHAQVYMMRFWKKEKTKLLEVKEDALHTEGCETRIGQDSEGNDNPGSGA